MSDSELTVDDTIVKEESTIGHIVDPETTTDRFLDNIFGKKADEIMSDVETKFSTVHDHIHEVKSDISDVQTKVKIVNDDLNEVQIGMKNVNERIDKVETQSYIEPLEAVSYTHLRAHET